MGLMWRLRSRTVATCSSAEIEDLLWFSGWEGGEGLLDYVEGDGEFEAVGDETVVFKVGVGVIPPCYCGCVCHVGFYLFMRF